MPLSWMLRKYLWRSHQVTKQFCFAVGNKTRRHVMSSSDELHKSKALTLLPQCINKNLLPQMCLTRKLHFMLLIWFKCLNLQNLLMNRSSWLIMNSDRLHGWYGVQHGCHWHLGSSFLNSQEEEGSRAERAVRWTLPSMLGAAACCTLEGAARCGGGTRGSSPL